MRAPDARIQGRTNRQTPEWASTHPLSENRMQRALAQARAIGRLGTGVINRDAFLAQLEGEYVDDDPEQGIVDGPLFTHPDFRIQFRVPPGYLMSNGTRRSPSRDRPARRNSPAGATAAASRPTSWRCSGS